MPGFSKKAKRHAAMSKKDKRRQLKKARRPTPVTVSYLPGMEPPPPPQSEAKFPFRAVINGEEVWVSRNAFGIQFDYA